MTRSRFFSAAASTVATTAPSRSCGSGKSAYTGGVPRVFTTAAFICVLRIVLVVVLPQLEAVWWPGRRLHGWSACSAGSKAVEANRQQHWLFGGPAHQSSPRVPVA